MEAAAAAGGSSSSLVFRGCELPPGFRFQPTDQEILLCYLKKKMAAAAAAVTSIIADVDIYKFDPWELPGKAVFGEGEWFFFSPRDRKYPNGARPNRTAGSGYWKATGTDKPILGQGARCLGVKKALVFYQGRSPKGTKTQWVMHEYRLLLHEAAAAATTCSSSSNSSSMRLDDWVLCRVRNKDYYTSCYSANSSSSSDQPNNNIRVVVRDDDEVIAVPDDASASASADDHSSAALVSVLESIKRNLSFQAIDELYLLHQRPAKRPNYNYGMMPRAAAGEDDHVHHTSFSISEDDDDHIFF
ncbi:unnamed protein product [Urochloa decumbens]|uniref:NAC domain-containing protein n=1 Tax=Urochloa decumbens TaxID=240449 RepID=A0ABC8YZR5_9POAL